MTFRTRRKRLNKVLLFLRRSRAPRMASGSDGGGTLAEPVTPAPRAPGGRNRMWIVIVAMLIVAIIGISTYAVLSARVHTKVGNQLWDNNDGHHVDDETAIALTIQHHIPRCGRA